jgi:hypothetical protein
MSVSEEYGMIFSTGTPSVSAATWQNIVSEPVPMSVAPMSRLNEPSSFILMEAAPISTPGMPEACMTMAMPTPRRTGPATARARRFSAHPMALAPSWMAWGRPHERTTWRWPSRPSPSASVIGCSSPSWTWLRRRNSRGSSPSAIATSSTWLSRAKKPCGQP